MHETKVWVLFTNMPSFQFFSKNSLKALSIKQEKAALPPLSVLPLMNLKRVAGWQWWSRDSGADFAGDSAKEATIMENTPSIWRKGEKIMCYFIKVTENVQQSVILVNYYILLLTVKNKKGSQNRQQIKSSNYFRHCEPLTL